MKNLLVTMFVVFLFVNLNLQSHTRVAVLPFQNMDGPLEYSSWCFSLQDSVSKMLALADKDENYYHLVPIDSIEAVLAEMNLDPSNPQYETDMWTAVKKLNIEYVISGFFIVDGTRVVISAYIYNSKIKLPDQEFMAKDIRKKKEKILDAVDDIVRLLLPGLQKLKQP